MKVRVRGDVAVASLRVVSLAATWTMVLFQILKGSVRERESEGNNFSPNDTIDYISTQHANGPFKMAAAPFASSFFFFLSVGGRESTTI